MSGAAALREAAGMLSIPRAAVAVALAVLAGPPQLAHARATTPDLTVKATRPPATTRPGATFTVTLTVRNGGSTAAPRTRTRIAFDDGVVVRTLIQPRLKAHARATRRLRLTVPQDAGRRRLIVCVDAGKAVRERSEQNNCVTAGRVTLPQVAAKDLVAADLKAGRIDEQQAYALNVVADAGGPDLLPARYRGATGAGTPSGATSMITAAASRFPTLNAKAQRILAPLFAPPAHVAANRASSRAEGKKAHCIGTAEKAMPDTQGWNHRTSARGVTFWWPDTMKGGAAKAKALAAEMDDRIWPKLTGLMHATPESDTGMLCGAGVGPGLDVYFVDTIGGRSWQDPEHPGDRGATAPYLCGYHGNPGFIRLADISKETLAHEFFHVLQLTFPDDCTREPWIDEGTAEWAVDLVYRKQLKDMSAAWLRDWTNIDLMHRSYDAWPFWWSVTHDLGDDVIRQVFAGLTRRPYLQAVDGIIGGFEKRWPAFAKAGYNQDPITSFTDWTATSLRPAPDVHVLQLGGATTRTVPYEGGKRLFALTRDYELYPVADEKLRRITFSGLASAPGYTVQAMVKLRNGGWVPRDITNGTTFCRDKPGEDVEELLLIGANAQLSGQVQGDPHIKLDDDCGTLHYKVLQAEFSTHTDGSTDDKTEQGCSTQVGGVKDLSGHLGAPVTDDDATLQTRYGLRQASVFAEVDASGSVALKGCTNPYAPDEAPCQKTVPAQRYDGKDTIGFQVEISPAHPDVARLTWRIHTADIGYIDPDNDVCNVFEFFNTVPIEQQVIEVPVDQVLRGTHTFTNKQTGYHWSTNSKGRPHDITMSWDYRLTVQVVDENGLAVE